MATKRFYATGAFKYQHRMLTAGDPVDMTAPDAKLFAALGKITDRVPRATEGRTAANTTTNPNRAPAKRKRAKKPGNRPRTTI